VYIYRSEASIRGHPKEAEKKRSKRPGRVRAEGVFSFNKQKYGREGFS